MRINKIIVTFLITIIFCSKYKTKISSKIIEYFKPFTNNEVKFNDSVFTKIADVIRRMFASFGIAKVDFESGRGAYNFLKDYNKSIHKGTLSKGVKAKASDVVSVIEDCISTVTVAEICFFLGGMLSITTLSPTGL